MKLVLLFSATVILVFSTRCHAVDVLIPGRVSVIRPGKLAKFVSKSAVEVSLPAPGSTEDPTIGGASLRFLDVFMNAEVAFDLHQSGWRGLGQPPGSKGYLYRGRNDIEDSDPKGTCRVVVLKGRSIKAVCRGELVALVTPLLGSEGVTIGIPAGTASRRYCADFGGEDLRNDATVLKRKNAPVPIECVELVGPCINQPSTGPFRTCGNTAPACHGTCPLGQSCWTRANGNDCECKPDVPTSCGDTGTVAGEDTCGGACPAGESCALIDVMIVPPLIPVTCACMPAATTVCTEFWAAGVGECPQGLCCEPRDLIVGEIFTCQ